MGFQGAVQSCSRGRVGAVCAAVAVVLALLPAIGAQAQQAPDPATSSVSNAPDYATSAVGEPWDFTASTDVRLLPDRTINIHNARFEANTLRYGVREGAGLLTLLFPGYPGSLYMNRDGGHLPIDADRLTHVTLRIHSSAPSPRNMALSYERCLKPEFADPSERCPGNVDGILLQPGWNTKVVNMRDRSAGSQHRWAGEVYALRLQHVPNDVDYMLDWVRVHEAPESVAVGGADYWTTDASTTTFSPGDRNSGRIEGGQFPAGAYPEGTYYFFSSGSGTGEPLRVYGRSSPVFSAPHLAGGEDFWEATMGRPLDFRTPSDVIAYGNMADISFTAEHGLRARNAPPNQNQPYFYVPLARHIDPARYHRLTVHTTYEGGFNLADEPGGGTHGRLLWTHAGRDQHQVIEGNKVIESKELVHYPDETSFTVDLDTDPPSYVMETDAPARDGWNAGHPITHVRYDPNEDRGPRRWTVRRIALRATHESDGNAFDITWHDAGTRNPGNRTVSLYYDTTGQGFNGTLIEADIPQVAGENRYRWDTSGVPVGRYWVYAVAEDPAGGQGRAYATGPVDVRRSIRIAGATRTETATMLSRRAFPDGAPAAIVARQDAFPDALAAAPLAAAAGGPILLNRRSSLDDLVRAELERLGVEVVYLMGGEGAQSAEVEQAIDALAGVEVVRLSGIDRFETAAAAAEQALEVWAADGHDVGADAILALGQNFPDALGAGPLAAHAREPMLLTRSTRLGGETVDALRAMGANRVRVVGGPAAISDDVVRQLQDEGISVSRIAGQDRFETAERAAAAAVQAGAAATTIVVASGQAFPDALAAGPAAYEFGGALLLTARASLPAPTSAWLEHRAGNMDLLRLAGGSAAVSDPVEQELIRAAGL